MARSVKRVVLVLLAAAVLAFAAWMLWPRSLGGAFAFDQPFTLTVTELEMQEDGSWTVKEPVSSVLEPGHRRQRLSGRRWRDILTTCASPL